MEYIKKEELIIGEIYNCVNNYNNEYIVKIPSNLYASININKNVSHLYKRGNFIAETLKWSLATSEEKHWLKTCITADKFITFEEAMKTFVPEYLECITNSTNHFTKNKIYRIQSLTNFNKSFNLLDNDNYLRNVVMNGGLWKFKPSTKEDYDAQFVVKKPEFVLKEKWYLKITPENKDIINHWRRNIIQYDNSDCQYETISQVGSGSSVNFINEYNKTYQEITFEQFKKYVLKEEIIEEEKVIEPLPQFKVIERIETITKVENNEGNQFFIGDVVKSSNGVIQTIESFDYNKNKTNIIAFTNKQSVLGNGIGIDKIEHYIEAKLPIIGEIYKNETLLDKAKRLYPIGTKFQSASSGQLFTIKNHIPEKCVNETTIVFPTIEVNKDGNYYGCVHHTNKWAERIK